MKKGITTMSALLALLSACGQSKSTQSSGGASADQPSAYRRITAEAGKAVNICMACIGLG